MSCTGGACTQPAIQQLINKQLSYNFAAYICAWETIADIAGTHSGDQLIR